MNVHEPGVTRLIPRTMCVPEGVQGRVIASCIRTVERRPGAVKKVAAWRNCTRGWVKIGDTLPKLN